MIRRETPKNVEDFIKINDEISINLLNQGGFYADYIDQNFLYFRRLSGILEYIKKHSLKVAL